jgi:hypothetical protein
MTWTVVPNLNELKDQLNSRFPNRDKTTDGTIGDLPHQESTSSHNPDLTGNAEWKDGDAKDEVRARDVDKDLNDSHGVTMEQVVQRIIEKARAGKLPWLRYVVYNGRIWHKRDNYVTRIYTGSNQHTDHTHLNSDFTQEADEVTGTNWYLSDLGISNTPPPVDTTQSLKVDGVLGPKTISKWQTTVGTPVDGVISTPYSQLVAEVQRRLNNAMHFGLDIDGNGIFQDNKWYHTAGALQRYLGSPVDGIIFAPVSECIKALQRRLNTGRF